MFQNFIVIGHYTIKFLKYFRCSRYPESDSNSKNVFMFMQKSWQSLFRLLRSEGVRPDIVSVKITHARDKSFICLKPNHRAKTKTHVN